MKKLMLACTAALFSFAVYAQEGQQDTTRTETNQYRENREEQTKENMDSTSIRQDAEEMKNQGQRELDTLEQDATQMRDTLVEQGRDAGTEVRSEARELRDSVRQDAEQTGNEINQGVQSTSDRVENNVKTTRDNLKQDATRVGNEAQETAEQTEQRLQNSNANDNDSSNQSTSGQNEGSTTTQGTTATQGSSATQGSTGAQAQGSAGMNSENSGEGQMASELEVVEGKEGPNNEIVYKFKGEMWYVDRQSKQMVKAEESKLKDSNHEVMVHEGSNTANAKNSNNRKKGKS